jgi:hypothetical protein
MEIKTIADVRRMMTAEEEENFFGRKARRFFGTTKVKFSKRNMTVTCVNRHGEAVYNVVQDGFKVTLRHARSV